MCEVTTLQTLVTKNRVDAVKNTVQSIKFLSNRSLKAQCVTFEGICWHEIKLKKYIPV